MEYRTAIFYAALLTIVGCIVELRVRSKGIGEHVEKIRGVVVSKKPKLAPSIVVLVFAIIVAVLTIPH